MRTIRLKLVAFGPYAEETEIDFSKFGESGIYIVTGETGAGKTSIFDGISFALFGEASGGNREAKSLRSKYAPDDLPTKVEFTFEYRGEIYRVERSPEYVRYSKRAGKPVKQPPDATLYLPDGRIVSKVGAVDKEINALLGVTKNQFNQIAMIAQGDFLKLLLASTDERIRIFRKIFGTERFDALQNRISDDYNECALERKRLKEGVRAAIEESGEGEAFASLTESEMCQRLKEKVEEDRRIFLSLKKRTDEARGRRAELNASLGRAASAKQAAENLLSVRISLRQKKQEKISLEKDKIIAEAKKEELQSLRNAIANEEARAGEYKEREAVCRRLSAIETELSAATKEREKLALSLEEEKKEQKRLSEILLSLSDVGAEYERASAERERLNGEREELKALSALSEDCRGRRSLLKSEEEKFLQSTSRYGEQSEKYARLYEAFLSDQAGILAETLKEGEPCPVCGSTVHPFKAKKKTEDLSQESVRAEKEKRDCLEKECSALSVKIAAERAALLSEEKAIEKRLSVFTNGGEGELEELLKEREASLLAAEEREKLLSEKKALKQRAERELEESRRKSDSYERQTEEATGKRDALSAEKAMADGKIQSLSSLRFRSLKEVRESVSLWAARAKEIEEEIDGATKRYDALLREISALEGSEKSLLLSAGEYSEEETNRLAAEDKELLKRIADYDAEIKAITEKGKSDKDAWTRMTALEEKLKDNAERWTVLSSLYATANGSVSGKERIRLETYVQMQYFDRVVARANARLYKMTDGQYELVRRENASDLRSQAGLDLDVIDYTNNTRREASTLSGGESFMASLSLALGLSDEIQSGSGGIRVDSMFIDEGFGSLSDDALDAAIDTLAGVSGGNVLIGVISHVDKLRERIDKQIVVTKGKDGSRVKIVE